jgi:toxin secretion/phage lysis holin
MMAFQQLTYGDVQWIIDWVSRALIHVPMVKSLLWLIGIDMVLGVAVAFTRRALSSTISFRGVTRKVTMLLMVAMGAVLEPFAQGLPVAQLVAMFYIVTEGISCLENAAALGVPLPAVLTDTLAKLREGQKKRIETKIPGGTDLAQNTAAVLAATEQRRDAANSVHLPLPVEIVNPPEHPVPVTESPKPPEQSDP